MGVDFDEFDPETILASSKDEELSSDEEELPLGRSLVLFISLLVSLISSSASVYVFPIGVSPSLSLLSSPLMTHPPVCGIRSVVSLFGIDSPSSPFDCFLIFVIVFVVFIVFCAACFPAAISN